MSAYPGDYGIPLSVGVCYAIFYPCANCCTADKLTFLQFIQNMTRKNSQTTLPHMQYPYSTHDSKSDCVYGTERNGDSVQFNRERAEETSKELVKL